MSYHVENPRFNELQKQLIVHEDGYMDAHKNECEPIVDYVYTLNGGDDKSRWAQLFGTPERAAKTIADACGESEYCGGCPAVEAYCHNGDYDELLEWLRGDAE